MSWPMSKEQMWQQSENRENLRVNRRDYQAQRAINIQARVLARLHQIAERRGDTAMWYYIGMLQAAYLGYSEPNLLEE